VSPPRPLFIAVDHPHCFQEEDLKDSILLVMANKQDQRGALKAADISERLGLGTLRTRQWSIQETTATKGEGLFEGFDWLVQCIRGGAS
jgi:ADP-ribosylation factor-like protein 1